MSNNTSYSLLRRALDGDDQKAWEELIKVYENFIYHVLLQVNVGQNDIDDIAQEVKVALVDKLKSYDRDRGRFRPWLGRVVRNYGIMHFRKKATLKEAPNRQPTDDLTSLDSLSEPEMDQLVEKEWRSFILDKAMSKVQQSFQNNALVAFEMSMNGKGTEEIAEELGVKPHSVYTLVSRVKKALIEEVSRLTMDLEA